MNEMHERTGQVPELPALPWGDWSSDRYRLALLLGISQRELAQLMADERQMEACWREEREH